MNNFRLLTIIYLFSFYNMEDIIYDKNYKKRTEYTFRGGVVLCFLQQICKIGFYYFSLKSVKIRFIMRGIEINT